ncbi:MAG TPA: response regulator [Sphingobacteriaceae bacterium]|nr:response regulator [Sphingobacteriaceae bacterium]
MSQISLVCIVDDDVVFQLYAKKLIESTQLVEHILQFPDGERAFEYFDENKDVSEKIPDLVFLDLNMPYMDGWQFLEEITSITFKKELITIYISTSSSSKLDQDKYASYPKLKGYLIKPLTKVQFLEVLEKELGLI